MPRDPPALRLELEMLAREEEYALWALIGVGAAVYFFAPAQIALEMARWQGERARQTAAAARG
jgi:hypothetical protein